jgi:predicted HNH restriction endonuclease
MALFNSYFDITRGYIEIHVHLKPYRLLDDSTQIFEGELTEAVI